MVDSLSAGGSPAVPDILILDSVEDDVFKALRGRSLQRDDETERVVKKIVDDVRNRGDEALLENARRFDAPGIESIVVSNEEIESAIIDDGLYREIDHAACRIEDFHFEQLRRFT